MSQFKIRPSRITFIDKENTVKYFDPMANGMKFLKPDQFAMKLNSIFESLKARIMLTIPTCEVEHIGSSAINGAISKGDLDILVRVDGKNLEIAVQKIQSIGFEIKRGTLRTESLCMLITREFEVDVAIQIIARGSQFEDFIKFRDRLNSDPSLVERYNALKIASTGQSPDKYRIKKSEFIESVLADK